MNVNWCTRLVLAGAVLAAAPAVRAEGPGPATVLEILDLSTLLEAPVAPRLHVGHGPVGLLQELPTEWGWGAGMKRSDRTSGVDTGPVTREENGLVIEEDVKVRGAEDDLTAGARGLLAGTGEHGVQVTRTRIGFEFGGFLPLGEKEEAFRTGQVGGLFYGFALPPLLEGFTITSELRLLEATTTSTDQADGFDVSSFLVLVKDDLLVHLFPRQRVYNVFYFLGLGLGLELSSAKDAAGGSESGTGAFFLLDTGLGGWVHLTGPLDLVFRLEFNLVPITENVPFFIVGQMGIQAKF